MMLRAMLAAAIAVSVGTSAVAQMPPQPAPPKFPTDQGSEQERAACHPDVIKFCSEAMPDQFKILTCLQTNRTKISGACRNVLTSHGV